MRGLLLLWLVGASFADIMPPPPSPEQAPAAQPVPDPQGEVERPLAPPVRPAVMPGQLLGCAGRSMLPLGALMVLGLVATQRRTSRAVHL